MRAGGHRGGHHLVAGQGACLVGADHRYRAQGLDRREAANDGVPARHGLHTHRESDCQHRGQTLWNGCNRQAHHRHEHVAKREVTHEVAEGKQQGGDQKNEHGQPACEDVHLIDQRRGHRLDP